MFIRAIDITLGLSVLIMLIVLLLEGPFYRRLPQPGYVRRMRFACGLGSLASAVYVLILTAQTLISIHLQRWENGDVVYELVSKWIWALIIVFWFFKYWKYFIFNTDAIVLAGWYMNQHLQCVNRGETDAAFDYLQKAAEADPSSVQTWGALANFSEYFLNDSQQADTFLARARDAYTKTGNHTTYDQAVLEHYTGKILQYREQYTAAALHLKKAWELDPKPARKAQYQQILEITSLMQEENQPL